MIDDGGEIQINTGSTMLQNDIMLIDEVYCWSSALTTAQKAWLYNGGAGRFVNGFGQF